MDIKNHGVKIGEMGNQVTVIIKAVTFRKVWHHAHTIHNIQNDANTSCRSIIYEHKKVIKIQTYLI